MAEVILRPARSSDIPAMLEIERACFSDPWSESDLEDDSCLVAAAEDRVVAFLIWRQVFPGDSSSPPEVEILNVAVHPEWRRQRLGTRLLNQLFQQAADYYLEVRESNHAAVALYQHLGFVEVSRRQKYYRHPTETAIVMGLKRC